MPWAKAWKRGCMVYLQRAVGNFSVAAMLGVSGELMRNAVLGLIIHLHLSKRLLVCLFNNSPGVSDFRYGWVQAAGHLICFFSVSYILVVSSSRYSLMAKMTAAVPTFILPA